MREKLAVWGASGHAKSVAEIVRLSSAYRLAVFIDTVNEWQPEEMFEDRPVLSGSGIYGRLRSLSINTVILGYGNILVREEHCLELSKQGLRFPVLCHPNSVVSESARIGEGTVVIAGAIINPGASIGKHTIINTRASIDHDCTIGDFCHVAPGCTIAGHVEVGEGSLIGCGSTVVDHVTIGRKATIGAGSVVLKDIPDNAVAYGIPAKVARMSTTPG